MRPGIASGGGSGWAEEVDEEQDGEDGTEDEEGASPGRRLLEFSSCWPCAICIGSSSSRAPAESPTAAIPAFGRTSGPRERFVRCDDASLEGHGVGGGKRRW